MLMRSTTPWPAACLTARTTTCGSPQTGGYQRTTTAPNATSAWPGSLLTGPRRRPAVLRDRRLPVDRRRPRPAFLRRPRHAHRRPALDALRRNTPANPVEATIYVVYEGREHKGSIQRLSARPLSRLRYQRTSVPDGKSSTQPTSS